MGRKKMTTTRQLMGIDGLTDYSVSTQNGELVYFIISPTNIGVLPESSITARVNALLGVLRSQNELEMMALNSRESFEANKTFYQTRFEHEPLPAVRELLKQDVQHLDNIQVLLATAREFYLVLRLRENVGTDVQRYLSTVEQRIKNYGFTVRRAARKDIKRMLGIYFEQNVTSESLEDYDGQRWDADAVQTARPAEKPSAKRPKQPPRKNPGNRKKKKKKPPEKRKDFLDMVAPSMVRFYADYFICGNTYRCVWALREYPTRTDDQAILRHLGEKDGLSLRIYARQATSLEEKQILTNAANKNRMNSTNTNNLQQIVTAESNLSDVTDLIASMQRNREPLVHCAVFLELEARDLESLKVLQADVQTELMRSKLNVDKLILQQLRGFTCVNPAGYNAFAAQFERVLPASSVANLYPFNYSGKTDRRGFYIGKDRYGTNVLVDFDQRDDDKTSANILILGNSGQGKSYLMKLLTLNLLEAGKTLISLDVEHEQVEMCEAVGGCFIDLMSGKYIINVLEPKSWGETDGDTDDASEPETFRKSSVLAQHISFLKDFFHCYKDFTDAHIDTLEILLEQLYREWGVTEQTDFSAMRPDQYPILSDLYALIYREYMAYNENKTYLYTRQMLQEVLLGIHSICEGADSVFFNGHTNISSDRFLVFGVKQMLEASGNVRNAMLFNVLSYMSNALLTAGNTVAVLDELYIWLDNPTAIKYIRNCLKRVRKKESALLMASQNLEDFNQPSVREMTKPLFSIPPHQFLFNAGSIDKRSYMDMLQLEDAEYELIKYPQRGVCLYKCGNERYLLEVHALEYKEKLFGKAGGR